jgi:DNA-binding NarL/FixJ family response regulator
MNDAAEMLIADDHPLFREALTRAVGRIMPHARVYEADTVDTLLTLVARHPAAELLLLDLHIPGAHGFSALAHLRKLRPQLPVVMVSAREDRITIQRAMMHGAAGFIPKSADIATLDQALATVLAGDEWTSLVDLDGVPIDDNEVALAAKLAELTPQQFRVLGMVCQGLLNKQIAHELGAAQATIKIHVSAVLRKLGVNTRTQAVMLMHQLSSDPSAEMAPLPLHGDED